MKKRASAATIASSRIREEASARLRGSPPTNSRVWLCLATALLVVGCASGRLGGSVDGRYLASSESGIVNVQIETASAQACEQLRRSLQERSPTVSPQALSCESADRSVNLPYSLSVRDASGVFRVATFNQNQCRGWASFIASTPDAKLAEGACSDTPQGSGGKRYFQVSDERDSVYVQMDFGTEANCLQFVKVRETASGKAPEHMQFACSNVTKRRELRYSATIVAEGRPPVVGIDVRDRTTCETVLRGMASQYPGYRPECRVNQ